MGIMGSIMGLSYQMNDPNNKETKIIMKKIRELQDDFLFEFCEFSPGAYCSTGILNAAFINYLRNLNSPDINKILRYNCNLLDMENYEHIKTFKYNYVIGSPKVYVNISLKSFPLPVNNQETSEWHP